MSQMQQAGWLGDFAANATAETRGDFIRKTYLHLLGAILAFAAIEFAIFQTVDVAAISGMMLGSGQLSWLIVLGLFMVVSWVANAWAQSATSSAMQYAGLGLYVVAQAVIFIPLLFIASTFYDGVITTAAISTLAIFIGLTAFVFITGKDFSFLGGILAIAGIAALVTIGLGVVIGFKLGLVFTVLMIALAGGYILYHTSNVMHHYRIGQHVAASLALFASVALLFWYMIQLLMQRE